jgi:hypothetical protein
MYKLHGAGKLSLKCSVCDNGYVGMIYEDVDNILLSFGKKYSSKNILTSLDQTLTEKLRILIQLISGGGGGVKLTVKKSISFYECT